MSITWSTEYKSGRGDAAWADVGDYQLDLWTFTGGHRLKIYFQYRYVRSIPNTIKDLDNAIAWAEMDFREFLKTVLNPQK